MHIYIYTDVCTLFVGRERERERKREDLFGYIINTSIDRSGKMIHDANGDENCWWSDEKILACWWQCNLEKTPLQWPKIGQSYSISWASRNPDSHLDSIFDSQNYMDNTWINHHSNRLCNLKVSATFFESHGLFSTTVYTNATKLNLVRKGVPLSPDISLWV